MVKKGKDIEKMLRELEKEMKALKVANERKTILIEQLKKVATATK